MHWRMCISQTTFSAEKVSAADTAWPAIGTNFTACCAVHQPTVSHHLRVLREAGWVNAERHGTSIYYAIRPEAIDRFRELAAGLAPGPARPLAELEIVVSIPAIGHATSATPPSDPALALPAIDPALSTPRVDQTH